MKRLTLLHTNDVHASFDRWLRAAALIRTRKAELTAAGETFLLLDGGDHLDVSINECLATEGLMNLEMLAELGYQAMGVGNNELLRYTTEQIHMLSKSSQVPWLLTNLRHADGSLLGNMKETLVLDLGDGLKVGLTGVTDQFKSLYEETHGFRNLDTLHSIREAIRKLQGQGATLIVLLSHLGYEADLALAPELEGIVDVIIGAHSHTVLPEPVLQNGVLIVQAGSLAQFLGELTLELDEQTGKIVRYEGRLHPVEMEMPVDETQAKILEQGRQHTAEFFGEKLTVLERDLSHEEFVQLIAEILRDVHQAEIGLMFGAMATEGISAGPVTKGDIFERCRSLINAATFEIQGKQLLGLLEERENPEIYETKKGGNGFRPNGIPIGKMQFAGLTWALENGNPVDVRVNGEPLDLERWYTAGSGEHLFYARICNYPSLEGSRNLEYTEFNYIKDVVVDYLRNRNTVYA